VNTPDYSSTQRDAFGALVKQGVYDAEFSHPAPAREFFARVLSGVLATMPGRSRVSVLDCGCGPGAWLAHAGELADTTGDVTASVYGFDITPEMVGVCRDRFAGIVSPDHFREGDILSDDSFVFPDGTDRFDVIFAYDVIQQLPRRLQFQACQTMLGRLAPSGVAIVFDHDSQSLFGRKMGVKKFATQYLGLRLVPRYYCNAKYPPLRQMASRLMQAGHRGVELQSAVRGHKCALIAHAKSN